MKLFNSIKSFAGKALLATMLACPVFVSCYDDSELREKIDLIVDQIFELEQKLNAEIKALNDLLNGKVLITGVSIDAETGVTSISLSTGTSIQVQPKEDLESYVTYIELSDGIKYWAYIDEDGKKQLFLDEDKNPVPVAADVPEVVMKDDETYIIVGGVEYPLSGNSVFSDYELHVDEYTGEVYAVTFTFGEDMTFTVAVDGSSCFRFVQSAGWSTVVIEDFYVPSSTTQMLQVEARGVIDYILEKPAGWKIEEENNPYMGTIFHVTAPSAEQIAAGTAEAAGVLKACAVLEGGKATIAKLYLTTDPFETFSVSFGNVNINMYSGLQKYVYGVCSAADYDEAAIFAVAEGLLTVYDYPDGYAVSDADIEGVSLAELMGSDLVPGEDYILWALPAIYYQTDEDAGYYLREDTFVTSQVVYSSVKFEIAATSFRDAVLNMELKGVAQYFTGLIEKDSYSLEDVVWYMNNNYYDPVTSPMTYNGSVFTFAGEKAESDTEYVVWIAPAEEGKTYTEKDVLAVEFATTALTSGGTVKVAPGTAVVTPMDVTVPLTAEGAETIYYTFIMTDNLTKYPDDASKATYLFESGKYVNAESVTVRSTDVLPKQKPGAKLTLMAVASDSEGKYGEVYTADFVTSEIEYNEMTVDLELKKNDPQDVQVKISATGGTPSGYLYWIGKTSETVYKSASYLGGNTESAQQYMYLNSGDTRFATVAANYPVVDGVITMTDLSSGVEYVVVAMAKDADGGYSKAVELKFTVASIALGELVMSTDPKWEASRPTIEWIKAAFYPASGQALDGSYSYYFSCGEGFTAYVMSGADGYFSENLTYDEIPVEDKIATIVEQADRVRDYDILYDDELWNTEGYPAGFYLYHAPHGCPLYGYAVLFPGDMESHKAECENPKCVDYTGGTNNRQLDVYFNNGEPVEFRVPGAFTHDDIDKVFVALKDKDGNFYEPYRIDVPDEYFERSDE